MEISERINFVRKEIVTDSYEMSIGELINLYRDGDLIISPEYQRLYRWDDDQKIRLIESILLWFPMPSIFVFQLPDGQWELIDGLQRLSTIFQFADELDNFPPLVLRETKKIPEFEGITWETLPLNLKRDFKRARVRIEILKSTSDALARYELFQRLNTGGSILSPQEVRNCVIAMINLNALDFLKEISHYQSFVNSVPITEEARQKAYDMELALRFISYRKYTENKQKWRDVHAFLYEFSSEFCTYDSELLEEVGRIFRKTFDIINEAAGQNAFKRKTSSGFCGQFLLTKFEVISYGVFSNIEKITMLDDISGFINRVLDVIDENDIYRRFSGSGTRAANRLGHLLELGENLFNPESR